MVEMVKNGDFIEIEYDGALKESGQVFDTTSAETAEKEGIKSSGTVYGPVTICLGESQILKGLDAKLEGLEVGKTHEINLTSEESFGKRSAKFMKLVPANVFKKNGMQPVVGLQVDIDGAIGTIRSSTGGRVIVDFNHPLSGKDIIYKVKIIRKVDDAEEKARSILNLGLNVKKDAISFEEKDGKKRIIIKRQLHPELMKIVNNKLGRLVKEYAGAELVSVPPQKAKA